MIVTSIEQINKKKYKITLDESVTIALYISELKRYNIALGKEINAHDCSIIFEELLPHRCEEKILYLIKDSDKSESEIRKKLISLYYPVCIIDKIIEKMKEYNYINDERYTKNYFQYNLTRYSLRKIRYMLKMKGIKEEIINMCLNDCKDEFDYRDLECEKIEREFVKKGYHTKKEDAKQRNKIIAALLRKGYEYDDICKVERKF